MKIALLVILCLFSTAVLADCKSDRFAGHQACAANNPNNPDGSVSDGRIICDFSVLVAYEACIAAQLPAQPSHQKPKPAPKK